MKRPIHPQLILSRSAQEPAPRERCFVRLRTLGASDEYSLAYLYDPQRKTRSDIYFIGQVVDGIATIIRIIDLQETIFSLTSRLVFEMKGQVELLLGIDELFRYALGFFRSGLGTVDAADRALANADCAQLIPWYSLGPAAGNRLREEAYSSAFFTGYPGGVEQLCRQLASTPNNPDAAARRQYLGAYLQFRLATHVASN